MSSWTNKQVFSNVFRMLCKYCVQPVFVHIEKLNLVYLWALLFQFCLHKNTDFSFVFFIAVLMTFSHKWLKCIVRISPTSIHLLGHNVQWCPIEHTFILFYQNMSTWVIGTNSVWTTNWLDEILMLQELRYSDMTMSNVRLFKKNAIFVRSLICS